MPSQPQSSDLLLSSNEDLLLSESSSSASSIAERVAEECTHHLTNCSGPTSLKDTASQLARELIERNLVSALKYITSDQFRVALRDEMILLLLKQMTGQLPASLLQSNITNSNSNNNNNNRNSGGGGGGVGENSGNNGNSVNGASGTKNNNSNNGGSGSNNNNNSNGSLPPGSENMAKLISQGSVSLRGSAMTIKRLLEAPDAIVRKTSLALLAKVAEDCARERRDSFRKMKEEYEAALEKYQQQLQQHQQHSRKNKFKKFDPASTAAQPVAPVQPTSSAQVPLTDRARAMELVKPTILDLLQNDPSSAYECNFIARCFGWLELPSLHIASHEALGLVRRSHRNVPCYSIHAGNVPEHSHINSFVATCGRDAPTIDIFRDVNISGDYAFSSFAVPQQFAPLSLVSLGSGGGNGNGNGNGNGDNSSESFSPSSLVALCCGVEVSERVGLGVIDLGESFPLSSSQTHHCDVKEVFGVSQPTCGITMGQSSIAVGCAVPGGFGVTTVAVETTQRTNTYSSSSSDCVTALTSAFGGDSCIISATRDGSLELWDLRRNPRGPTQTIVASSLKSNNTVTNFAPGSKNILPQYQQQPQQTRFGGSGGSTTSSLVGGSNVGGDAQNGINSRSPRHQQQQSQSQHRASSYYSADATTALAFLQGGTGGYSNNLLVSGTADGLVSVWDLRAVYRNQQTSTTLGSGGSNNDLSHSASSGIPSRPLTTLRLDGPILNIASIPNNRAASSSNDSSTCAYFAVSTTRTLSTHRLKMNAGDDDDDENDNDEDNEEEDANHADDQEDANDDDENDSSGQDEKYHDDDDDNDAANDARPQNISSNNRNKVNTNNHHKRDGLISTQQMIACRTTVNPKTNQLVPCLYHDLSVVQNFAGGKHTYLLAGSDGGVIESFRVRYL